MRRLGWAAVVCTDDIILTIQRHTLAHHISSRTPHDKMLVTAVLSGHTVGVSSLSLIVMSRPRRKGRDLHVSPLSRTLSRRPSHKLRPHNPASQRRAPPQPPRARTAHSLLRSFPTSQLPYFAAPGIPEPSSRASAPTRAPPRALRIRRHLAGLAPSKGHWGPGSDLVSQVFPVLTLFGNAIDRCRPVPAMSRIYQCMHARTRAYARPRPRAQHTHTHTHTHTYTHTQSQVF